MSPDEMISRALAGDAGGGYGQELYSAFLKDYPIEKLRPLLTSTSSVAQSLGAYLAYELGWKVHPFVAEISSLLVNPDPQIRSDAIYALADCTTPNDGVALGRVILRLDDVDPFVQRGAMRFIQMCDHWQLRLGVQEAAKLKPSGIFAQFPKITGELIWLPITQEAIEALVSHSSPVAQRFGVGLAARPRPVVDAAFLDIADRCEEKECRRILRWAREKPLLTYSVQGRVLTHQRWFGGADD